MDNDFGTDFPSNEVAQNGKSNKTLMIVVIVLVVLCCCCVGVSALFYFVLGDPLLEMLQDLMGVHSLLLTV